jgi:hypothetical protein
MTLKLLSKVGVFALALLLSAVPTMACLLPTVTLTTAEHECCKRMAGQCGQSGMPSSHSCCQRLTGPEDSFVKAPNVQLDHISSISYVSGVSAPLLPTGIPLVHATLDFGVHGPPGSPPTTISVLRI